MDVVYFYGGCLGGFGYSGGKLYKKGSYMNKLLNYGFVLLFLGLISLEARDLKAVIADDFPNTVADAVPISFGITINGSIETSIDYDYFKFELKQTDGIIINNAGNDNSNYPYIFLLDSNGKQLAKEMVSRDDEVASINLNAGTYYIGVYYYGDGTTNYHFDLSINGAEAPTIVLDTATVAYCKLHPLECGITNGSLAYTEADINKTVTDTKTFCVSNPTACGIVTTNPLTANDISLLNSGWHLLGTSEEMTDLSILDNVKTVWSWNNGWKAYSHDNTIKEAINNSSILIQIEKA